MRLTALLPPLLTDPTTADLVAAASSRTRTDRTVVVAPGARPAVLAALTLGADGVARATGATIPPAPAANPRVRGGSGRAFGGVAAHRAAGPGGVPSRTLDRAAGVAARPFTCR